MLPAMADAAAALALVSANCMLAAGLPSCLAALRTATELALSTSWLMGYAELHALARAGIIANERP